MGFPIYIRDLPKTEIEAGHVSLAVGGVEFVATVALYREFLERECERLSEWERSARSEGAEVIRLRESG